MPQVEHWTAQFYRIHCAWLQAPTLFRSPFCLKIRHDCSCLVCLWSASILIVWYHILDWGASWYVDGVSSTALACSYSMQFYGRTLHLLITACQNIAADTSIGTKAWEPWVDGDNASKGFFGHSTEMIAILSIRRDYSRFSWAQCSYSSYLD